MVELDHLFCTYLSKDLKVSDTELRRGHLDMSGLLIQHQEAKYNYNEAVDATIMEPTNKLDGQVTFHSELTNTTGTSQTLVLRAEREISSTYKVSLQRCFTKAGSVTLSITAPKSIAKLGMEAKQSIQVTGGRESTVVDKTKWSLDTSVVVGSRTKTSVEIKLEEKEFDGSFSVTSYISGRVVFRPKCADGSYNWRNLPYIIDDVRNVLVAKHGFQLPEKTDKTGGERAVIFKSQGRINCRCGVKQHVRLTEEKLTSAAIELSD